MLVYGDQERVETGRSLAAGIEATLRRAAALPPGIGRHGELAAAFIAGGEWLQGIADRDLAERGADDPSPAQDACAALLSRLAGALLASWDEGFAGAAPDPASVLSGLGAAPPDEPLRVRTPEGYAFYALYPEGYAEAARRLGLPGPVRVIGIRSIGTGLAALAAAALGAPFFTLRPGGHPFRREVAVGPRLARAILGGPETHYVVADEGPGLSGSSFGAVADWLEANGVPASQVHFLPSHPGGLGPRASPEHRERWEGASRPVVAFPEIAGRAGPPLRPRAAVELWAADLVGEAVGPAEDVSGGAWRSRLFPGEELWPAANVSQERLKFVVSTASGDWLLRFAGLGLEGERKLARAHALAEAGFVPEPAGFRHGFLVERWYGDARPSSRRDVGPELLDRVAGYLAFRGTRFPARPGRGADLAGLAEMARRNAGEALGREAEQALAWLGPEAARLQGRVRPVEVDGRMHLQEWLRLPDGRILKADALDHHAAHDLVGCQDLAWDVAGAAVELGLEAEEAEALRAGVSERLGRPVDPELVAFLLPCYLAFQLGSAAMAAAGLDWPEEKARLEAEVGRYASMMGLLLVTGSRGRGC